MNYFDYIFDFLQAIDNFFWSYIGFTIICSSGIYLTIKSKGKQFKVLTNFRRTFKDLIEESRDQTLDGLHPIKLLFTTAGGKIGIGNIVGVGIAVTYGGPGSIFWMWVASFCGMLIKYSEIYLGVKHRVKNSKNSYNGGPMYYLQDIFGNKFLATISSILLCIYGIEVFQFVTLVDRFEGTFNLDRNLVIFTLLIVCLYSSTGGIKRLSNICSSIMPFFTITYILCCSFIIASNGSDFTKLISQIFQSAFTGQAAIGGFAGSTMLQAAYLGISKAVYAGDIGIGYDSVVQSETRAVSAVKQARLGIVALFLDMIIYTLSCFTIGITGAWHNMTEIEPSEFMSTIFSRYFSFSEIFITSALFFAGFATVIAFLTVGTKSAQFLSPRYGKNAYLIIASAAFVFFCQFSETKAAIIMSVTSVFLVTINIIAILKMRKEIKFNDK
jgi:AGCS family alanine or glycine:cation symporter